jgi:aspartate-semialdehyde dehydrogenase
MSRYHPSVAIVGATGAVGTELLGCLEQRSFPLRRLRLFASARSTDRALRYRGESLPVQALDARALADTDIALFCAGGAVSRQHVPRAVGHGAVGIDK